MLAQEQKTIHDIIRLLAELTVHSSLDFEAFLNDLIKLIGKIIPSDSCFIYIYDEKRGELVLVGSKIPKQQLLGEISLKLGEGITGWVAEHKSTVSIAKEAYKDQRFHLVPELPEDKFEAFLSLPIVNQQGLIGVLNLQHRAPRKFTKKEVSILEMCVAIIASAFAQVMLRERVSELEQNIADRKLVDQAKGLLMREKGLAESEAYKLIQTEAMRKRKTKREIAEAVILVFGQP